MKAVGIENTDEDRPADRQEGGDRVRTQVSQGDSLSLDVRTNAMAMSRISGINSHFLHVVFRIMLIGR